MRRLSAILLMLARAWALPAPGEERSRLIASMDGTDSNVVFDAGSPTPVAVAEGPGGQQVLRFEGSATYAARIDCEPRGVDLHDCDLIKVQIKADRAAVVVFSPENYPDPTDLSRWYVLDALRGPFDWRTIWIDLRFPEEIKSPPYKDWWVNPDPAWRGIRLHCFVKDTGRESQGAERRIWIGEIRAVRKAVDLDWDQTDGSYSWETGRDLVYTYPLSVSNCLADAAVTARLSLVAFDAPHASAALSSDRLVLGPNERGVVQARVRLPAAVAASAPLLYCERFETRAEAEGMADSDVTILRSSDPIHLTVTRPVPEEKLRFPLLAPPRELRDLSPGVLYFDPPAAESCAAAADTPAERQALIAQAMTCGIANHDEAWDAAVAPFRKALIAAAYLYDYTGVPSYLDIAADLLGALPAIWQHHYREWENEPVREISSGIVVRWRDGFHYTLGLGWRTAGTQRSPYQYSYDPNSSAGSMSAILYAFDMLAADLDPALRQSVIHGFLVPAAIQCRNHYIGDGNQQATANAVALYGGLAARNWPLVSFAASSEHGLPGIVDWTFTDEGVHIRDGYQTYVLRPIFWLCEMLDFRGVHAYNRHRDRLDLAVHVDLGSRSFQDLYFWNFITQHRFTSPTGPLTTPSNLVAVATSPFDIHLRWADVDGNEEGFTVERSLSASSGFTAIGTTPENVTTCLDVGLSPDTTYYYRVSAFNQDGTSLPSDPASATTVRRALVRISRVVDGVSRHSGSGTFCRGWKRTLGTARGAP